jgi:6-phosphogluconolactonase
MPSDGQLLFVGTYTVRGSEGIYAFRMDPGTGDLEPVGRPAAVENPSFLAADPTGRFLYAVQENGPEGGVAAFRINHGTGELAPINSQLSHGSAPCHLSVDQTGRFVVAANYSSGSVTVLPVGEAGELREASCVIQHAGQGVDPERQEGPHAHSATIGPDNQRVFVADLGLDKVFVYRLDLATGELHPNEMPWLDIHPGAGPRHMAFHPSGRLAFVINELDNTLVALGHDPDTGALTELQTVPTLPADFTGTSFCADVHVHPSGRFVYGSNRGHDSLAIFGVEAATGRLALVGHEPTGGRNPRNFALAPGGEFLLAANQDTDDIVTFRLDGETGRLSPTGHVTRVPAPVCLCFVAPARP